MTEVKKKEALFDCITRIAHAQHFTDQIKGASKDEAVSGFVEALEIAFLLIWGTK